MRMPGIDGLEVCRRLRQGQKTRNLPIIMLTARGEETDRIRGLDTGAEEGAEVASLSRGSGRRQPAAEALLRRLTVPRSYLPEARVLSSFFMTDLSGSTCRRPGVWRRRRRVWGCRNRAGHDS